MGGRRHQLARDHPVTDHPGIGIDVGQEGLEHPHPLRSGKQPRILFGTQAANRPPTFVLFTTGFLDPQYRRFITRRLREIFGFEGTPITVNMRVREKRKRP